MVGATGFEPATSCSRSRRATGLRYAPPNQPLPKDIVDAPGGTRIPNLLIRSQMLYPIELRARKYNDGCIQTRGQSNADADNRPPHFASQPTAMTLSTLCAPKKSAKTKPPGTCRGEPYERYKTRTCDLHDVNVAL